MLSVLGDKFAMQGELHTLTAPNLCTTVMNLQLMHLFDLKFFFYFAGFLSLVSLDS